MRSVEVYSLYMLQHYATLIAYTLTGNYIRPTHELHYYAGDMTVPVEADTHLNKMAQAGSWGDGNALSAVAVLYCHPINV